MKNESAALTQTPTLRTGAYWMPFTHNRYLKRNPRSRILARAQGAYYTTAEGARLFDCLSGLWCCPLGHGHPKIAEAVAKQVKELDYSPAFQMGHPKIFSLAERLVELAPAGMGQVFFACVSLLDLHRGFSIFSLCTATLFSFLLAYMVMVAHADIKKY